jgi:hypothetical protein
MKAALCLYLLYIILYRIGYHGRGLYCATLCFAPAMYTSVGVLCCTCMHLLSRTCPVVLYPWFCICGPMTVCCCDVYLDRGPGPVC